MLGLKEVEEPFAAALLQDMAVPVLAKEAPKLYVKLLQAREDGTAKEKPQRGTVVAAGPGTKDEKMEVKVGDSVLYGKYSGTELSFDGKDYLIMKQSDILAIV